ncbi:MAG TPA: hypothetical protein VLF68_00190 [Candidatus Saccharimonadales bacterium]|nr:hypothetical protein [Candidatus Saccharimonadales bacterium]
MTTGSEQGGPPISEVSVVENDIRNLTSRLGVLMNGRRRVSAPEQPQLDNLRTNMHSALVHALTLRKAGEDSIRVTLAGDPREPVFAFSANLITISFEQPESDQPTWEQRPAVGRSQVRDLARIHKGDIAELIGKPDNFEEEPPSQYISRLIVQIRDASKAAYQEHTQGNENEARRLHSMKASLAELAFEGLIRHGNGRFSLEREEKGLGRAVDHVTFINNEGASMEFSLLPNIHYQMNPRLGKLVERELF